METDTAKARADEAARKAWGNWLTRRMKAQGLNAYKVADAMADSRYPATRQAVERWMKGARVDGVYVRKLAEVLDVGAVALLRAIEGEE